MHNLLTQCPPSSYVQQEYNEKLKLNDEMSSFAVARPEIAPLPHQNKK